MSYKKEVEHRDIPKGVQNSILNDAIVKDLWDAIGTIDFGTITIKVHEYKIVQVEVTTRKRFDDVWKLEGGAGI
jgi:hypothetical protein